MEIRDLHQYDHGVDAVFKFFSDPDRIKAKFEGIGARNLDIVECTETEGGLTTQSRREVPADVPGILKKFLGAWNKVEQTEEWSLEADGVYRCELTVEIAGVPVNVTGTMVLSPQGKGCVNEVSINITCGIPLIGGKLTDFVGGDTKKAMDAEYAFIKDSLAKPA